MEREGRPANQYAAGRKSGRGEPAGVEGRKVERERRSAQVPAAAAKRLGGLGAFESRRIGILLCHVRVKYVQYVQYTCSTCCWKESAVGDWVSRWLERDFSSYSSNQKASTRRQRVCVDAASKTLAVIKGPAKILHPVPRCPYYKPLPAGAHPQKTPRKRRLPYGPTRLRSCKIAAADERGQLCWSANPISLLCLSSTLECIARSPHIASAPQLRLNPEPFLLRPQKSRHPPTVPAFMSEQQPQSRGGFRGRGPRGDRGGRAGAPSSRSGAQKSGGGDTERPKKENILDLSKYLNKALRVKFSGGREGMADLWGAIVNWG